MEINPYLSSTYSTYLPRDASSRADNPARSREEYSSGRSGAAPQPSESRPPSDTLPRTKRVEGSDNSDYRLRAYTTAEKPSGEGRNRITRDNDSAITELRPLVIEQFSSPATRVFLSIANPREEFRLIDTYV